MIVPEKRKKLTASNSLTAPNTERGRGRISVPEIAARLSIGRMAVYSMLEQRIIPAIRLGRRWIVTRFAYEDWERRCGRSQNFPLDTNGAICV